MLMSYYLTLAISFAKWVKMFNPEDEAAWSESVTKLFDNCKINHRGNTTIFAQMSILGAICENTTVIHETRERNVKVRLQVCFKGVPAGGRATPLRARWHALNQVSVLHSVIPALLSAIYNADHDKLDVNIGAGVLCSLSACLFSSFLPEQPHWFTSHLCHVPTKCLKLLLSKRKRAHHSKAPKRLLPL